MSDEIKELVKRLRYKAHCCCGPHIVGKCSPCRAADALEAMAGEVERLKASLKDAQGRAHARALLEGAGIDADGCLAEVARDFARRAIAAEAERDRLKAALGELQEDNMWLQAVQGNLRSIMRAHQKDCPNCHGKGAVEVPYDSADLNDTSTVTEHCKQCARLRAALGDAS